MKTFRRLFQTGFLVVLLAVATAAVSAAQDAPPPPSEQPAYPADQAPPPPAEQTAPSVEGQSAYPADQAPLSTGDQSAYPLDQAPPSAGQPLPSDGGQTADPSGRVARLGYMTGSVSVQPQGTGDWVQGSLNRPLTNADNVWADRDSRAELNLGTGVMRISSETSLTLTNVTNDTVQVELHQGTLNVHIRKLYDGEVYEIDTPNQAFTVKKSGEYRFDVDPNGDTTLVTVWKGEGEASGQGAAVRVHEGQQARFTSGNSLAHQISDAPRRDGFDDWCKVRDKHEDESVSARYVAPGVVGASDLDEYGNWRETPQYGNVWVPSSVPPGWAPYSAGHWIWQPPWGWTWVDDAPWGFAPSHYGRWVDYDGGWGWAPGPYYERPYYAPALVAWFGGPSFGIGINFGLGFGVGFGWCPLGFGEPFFPWYGGSRGYFNNVNISNTRITNINNITNNYYNNRNGGAVYGRNGIGMPRFASRPGALTAVSSNTLQRGLPVAGNRAHISPGALRNLSSASIGRPNLSPTRASVLGPKAGLPAAHPSAAAASRPTVSRMTPPRASSKPSPAIAASHNNAAPAARNTAPPAASHGGQLSSARSLPQPAGRSVPRPPQSLGNSNSATMSSRGLGNPAASRNAPQMALNHNVPRPPQSSARPFSGPSAATGARSMPPSSSPGARSVPRPPAGSSSRPTMSSRNTAPSMSATPRSYGSANAPRSYGSPNMGRSAPYSAPRPSGSQLPAPRNYPSAQSRGSYSARSYGGGNGGYGGYRGYSGSPYGGSSSRGSYGGRSYSAPSSHSSGSYGGGGSHGGFGGGGSHGGFSGGSHASSGGGSHGSSGGGSHGGHR